MLNLGLKSFGIRAIDCQKFRVSNTYSLYVHVFKVGWGELDLNSVCEQHPDAIALANKSENGQQGRTQVKGILPLLVLRSKINLKIGLI